MDCKKGVLCPNLLHYGLLFLFQNLRWTITLLYRISFWYSSGADKPTKGLITCIFFRIGWYPGNISLDPSCLQKCPETIQAACILCILQTRNGRNGWIRQNAIPREPLIVRSWFTPHFDHNIYLVFGASHDIWLS